MTALTARSRAAFAQVIEAVPDDAVAIIMSAVSHMPGERARELEDMLSSLSQDRQRRRQAFDAIIPLFRAREDGLEALTFPPAVLARLWRTTSERAATVLPMLDSLKDADASYRAMARSRLYLAAAALVRDEPDLIWPPVEDATAEQVEARQYDLNELARCCDMGMLAHRATRDLVDWTGRPGEDRLVELKLMVRDAAQTEADGLRRLMDIMLAHVDEAPQILSLATHMVGEQASLLKTSELSVVVERILDGLELRSGRISDFKMGGAVGRLRLDLVWAVAVVETLDHTVRADLCEDWARRISAVKAKITRMIDSHLKAVPKVMTRVQPLRDAQTAGRMTRKMPRLDAPVEPEALESARNLADLIAVLRPAAPAFGCEARRLSVVSKLTGNLAEYAELIIEMLSADAAPDAALDAALASKSAVHIADLLERIEAVTEARTVRRRISALSSLTAQPRAA